MNRYLLLHCGPYRLLLDIRHVVEVADAPADAVRAVHFRRPWREGQLAGTSLPAFLGATPVPRTQQVVLHGAGATTACIDVDRVESLVELADDRFATFSGVSPRLQRLCDAVTHADDGACLLRLRHPFAWQDESDNPGELP